MNVRPTLGELGLTFLRLGATAFGGPAAHIGLIEQEAVRRRCWLTAPEFLDALAAAMILPGPTSTELAMYVGHRTRGWRGLIVAGAAFILPAATLVLTFAWLYTHGRRLPALNAMLVAIDAVVIGVIAEAIWALGVRAVTGWWTAVVGLAAAAAAFGGVGPLSILAGAAALGLAASGARQGRELVVLAVQTTAPASLAATTGSLPAVSLTSLTLVFLKMGVAVFGSGYVLVAFLRAELVTRLGWVSERQLLDAIAAGQMTPGPVFTTATFLGYLIAGAGGAMAATLAVFAPAFVMVAVSGPIVARLRRSRVASTVLDAVTVAALAIMLITTGELARTAINDGVGAVLALAAFFILRRYRINSAWLIAAAALIGFGRSISTV